MPAFELVAAGTAWRNRPNQRQSRCEDGASNPCLHASAPRTNSSATQDRPAACGPVSPRTQAAGITSGASGDDGADDNPSGGGGANGGWRQCTWVVMSLASTCTAAAPPGLASDNAWARSVGAARISNAPTAASPRSRVTFIYVSSFGHVCHARAARLIEQPPRRDADRKIRLRDVNVN